jgi:hypothetical protein
LAKSPEALASDGRPVTFALVIDVRCPPDVFVAAHPPCHVIDIAADFFADVGHYIDEPHLGGEERIGCTFDQLGGEQIGVNEPTAERYAVAATLRGLQLWSRPRGRKSSSAQAAARNSGCRVAVKAAPSFRPWNVVRFCGRLAIIESGDPNSRLVPVDRPNRASNKRINIW